MMIAKKSPYDQSIKDISRIIDANKRIKEAIMHVFR